MLVSLVNQLWHPKKIGFHRKCYRIPSNVTWTSPSSCSLVVTSNIPTKFGSLIMPSASFKCASFNSGRPFDACCIIISTTSCNSITTSPNFSCDLVIITSPFLTLRANSLKLSLKFQLLRQPSSFYRTWQNAIQYRNNFISLEILVFLCCCLVLG